MFDDYEIIEITRMRRKELLEEARNARLLKDFRAEKPGYRDRLLATSGELLISLGQRLKERGEVEMALQNSIQ